MNAAYIRSRFALPVNTARPPLGPLGPLNSPCQGAGYLSTTKGFGGLRATQGSGKNPPLLRPSSFSAWGGGGAYPARLPYAFDLYSPPPKEGGRAASFSRFWVSSLPQKPLLVSRAEFVGAGILVVLGGRAFSLSLYWRLPPHLSLVAMNNCPMFTRGFFI